MHNYQVLMGEVGYYVHAVCNTFAHNPKIRTYWMDVCLWWESFKRYSLTTDDIDSIERVGYELHTRAEILLPTRAMTWTMHYTIHMAAQLRAIGPGPVWSMYSNERNGAAMIQATHTSRELETGIRNMYIMRYFVSFWRVHDPSLFVSTTPNVRSRDMVYMQSRLPTQNFLEWLFYMQS